MAEKKDWIENPRQNLPPEGVLVHVRGSDGEWRGKATRKDYKKGSTPAQLNRRFRWIQQGSGSDTWGHCDVDAWAYIEPIN